MKKTQKPQKHISLRVEVAEGRTKGFHRCQELGILFLYQPYQSQLKIMREIHNCLETSSNGLIQSPTGTGKTLCLLTGCLSYFYLTKATSKIYYLTRTHSQIDQIISEVKKTPYKCKTTIIASRELMCVNNSLRLIKGKLLDRKCQEYCSKGMCRYYTNQKRSEVDTFDIQELRELGVREGFCPYYYSRQMEQQSELVVLPYNYFLSYNLFQHNGFNIKDAVIIIDQAHNVDQIAQEGCSFSLTQELIQKAVANLSQCVHSFQNYSEKKKITKHKQMNQVYVLKELLTNLCTSLLCQQPIRFKDFRQFINHLSVSTDSKSSLMFPQGVTLISLKQICEMGRQSASRMKFQNLVYSSLEEVVNTLNNMTDIMSECQDRFFQVSITEQEGKRRILFLCLSAAVIFSKIKQRRPRSILLASGTLKPLDYWQQETGIKFSTKLQSQSFITNRHLYSNIVPAYKGHEFDFSYLKRGDQQQLDHLLELVNDICSVVPNGVVVAFSTYEVMHMMLEQHTSDKFVKKLFWESKESNLEGLMREYSIEAKSGGALLFMVMRGKFAEGIDFHDELCRAMIVVGIPFPPVNDPKLEAKKRFFSTMEGSKITYDQWYMIQASRVINQAIGRVIRHTNDYGCVFLVDRKYERQQIRTYLSQWLLRCCRSLLSLEMVRKFMRRIVDSQESQPSAAHQVGFTCAKNLLILQDIESKEQSDKDIGTTKIDNSKASMEVDDTPTPVHPIHKIEAVISGYQIPDFPQKQARRKKLLGDIQFSNNKDGFHRD